MSSGDYRAVAGRIRQDLAGAPTGDPWLVFGGEGDYLRQDVRVRGWRALLKYL